MPVAVPNGDDYGTYRDQLLEQERRARDVIERAVIPQAHGRSHSASSGTSIMSQASAIQTGLPGMAGKKTDGIAHIDVDGTTITMPIKAELSYDPNDHRWHVTVLPKQAKIDPTEWQQHTPPSGPPSIPRDNEGRQYRSVATKPRTRRRD